MTSYWRIHEKSKSVARVKNFVEKMEAIGAAGGSEYDSYVYEKDDFVLVATYRPVDGEMVGRIMTKHVYEQMKLNMRNGVFSLPNGYFAWAYGYGYDYMKDGISPEYIMEHLADWTHIYAAANTAGRYFGQVVYMVVDWRDTKPKGEYGVQEDYYVVGITDDIERAEYMVERAMADKPDWNDRALTIKPVMFNTILDGNDRVYIGGTCCIE